MNQYLNLAVSTLLCVPSLLLAAVPQSPVTFKTMWGPDNEINGVNQSTWAAEIPGKPGHFIVSEKHGSRMNHLYPNPPGSDVYQKQYFGGMPGISSNSTELGAQCHAIHPDFINNRKYYDYYTMKEPRRMVVVERKVDETYLKDTDNTNNMGRIIITIDQPPPRDGLKPNNNGGQMNFGPDGMLYICTGDANAPYSKSGLLSKVLRINVDISSGDKNYSIPPDNPFLNDPVIAPEVWALGIKFSWRGSWDFVEKKFYAVDIGPDGRNSTHEVNIIEKGKDYGWPEMVGDHCYSSDSDQADKTAPWFTVTMNNDSAYHTPVIGGFVFRGDPGSRFYGIYIFAIRSTREILAMDPNDPTMTEPVKIATAPDRPNAFMEDLNGNLYIVCQNNATYKIINEDMKGRN